MCLFLVVYYVLLCFILNTMSIIASVIVIYIHHQRAPSLCSRSANAVGSDAAINKNTENFNFTVAMKDTTAQYNGNVTNDLVEITNDHCHQASSERELGDEAAAQRSIIRWFYLRERKKIEKHVQANKWSNLSSKIDHVLFVVFLALTISLMIFTVIFTTLYLS